MINVSLWKHLYDLLSDERYRVLNLLQDYVVHVTDDFLEFISDGALAIEVWGHRCAVNGRSLWESDALEAKTQTLRDRFMCRSDLCTFRHRQYIYTLLIWGFTYSRWSEVMRSIELWTSIQELNEQGEYSSVELHSGKDISTGGVFQLRQVREKVTTNYGSLNSPALEVVQHLDVHSWARVQAGPLQEAAGVREAPPTLWHSASAGGGCAVCLHRLCVRSLHKTTETARQLPGLWKTRF